MVQSDGMEKEYSTRRGPWFCRCPVNSVRRLRRWWWSCFGSEVPTPTGGVKSEPDRGVFAERCGGSFRWSELRSALGSWALMLSQRQKQERNHRHGRALLHRETSNRVIRGNTEFTDTVTITVWGTLIVRYNKCNTNFSNNRTSCLSLSHTRPPVCPYMRRNCLKYRLEWTGATALTWLRTRKMFQRKVLEMFFFFSFLF